MGNFCIFQNSSEKCTCSISILSVEFLRPGFISSRTVASSRSTVHKFIFLWCKVKSANVIRQVSSLFHSHCIWPKHNMKCCMFYALVSFTLSSRYWQWIARQLHSLTVLPSAAKQGIPYPMCYLDRLKTAMDSCVHSCYHLPSACARKTHNNSGLPLT